MKLLERRLIASLLLLLGFSSLLIAAYTGQFDYVLNLIEGIIESAAIGF
ncbi:hypothetical protein J7K27_01495 [Candidatus Bathyarchaeota archaeon]|nr:hypothetical protein [Candidatus Bathyarchaeota archaeon]